MLFEYQLLDIVGSDGLFVVLIIGLISVEICRVVEKKFVFKLPESVPTAVTNFINSLLPLLVNIIIIFGSNLLFKSIFDKSIPELIMAILTPAISGVDNVWGFIVIFAFSNILWLFGINGSSIIFPIVFTVDIKNVIFMFALIAISVLVYYPFFKTYERNVSKLLN